MYEECTTENERVVTCESEMKEDSQKFSLVMRVIYTVYYYMLHLE